MKDIIKRRLGVATKEFDSLNAKAEQLYSHSLEGVVEQCPEKYFFKIDDIYNMKNFICEIKAYMDKNENDIEMIKYLKKDLPENLSANDLAGKLSVHDLVIILNKFVGEYEITEKTFEKLEIDDETKKIKDKCPYLHPRYIFSWNEIPEKDNGRLIKFLTQKFGIDWVKTVNVGIEKIDNKTIKVFTEKNSLSLILNSKNHEVILKIDDGRTGKFIATDELNIYDPRINGKCYHLKRLLLENAFPNNLKKFIELPRSWEDFKLLTEAKDRWNQYVVTKKDDFLVEAYELCKKIKMKNSKGIFFKLCYNLGIEYFENADYGEAAIMFSKASGLNPNASAYTGEGFALRYLKNDFHGAMVCSEKALLLDNNCASPWDLLGNIYLGLGAYASELYDKSITCLNQAIKRDADSAYPWLFLCINYSRKAALEINNEKRKKYVEIALDCIDKAEEHARIHGYKMMPTIKTAKAACLLQRGFEEDVAIAKNMINNSLKDQHDNHNKACSLYLLGKNEEANEFLRKALKENFYTKAQILFDPDIYEAKSKPLGERRYSTENLFGSVETCKRFYNIKCILSDFDDKSETIDSIREILLRERESDYILASFEVASGNKKNAIDIIKKMPENERKKITIRILRKYIT